MLYTQKILKRLGAAARYKERDRRPSLDELDNIITHYEDRQVRVPNPIPDEICRIGWSDFDESNSRILVRDMKNPGEKGGNHVWCDLVPEGMTVYSPCP